jgi:hypothetical protein
MRIHIGIGSFTDWWIGVNYDPTIRTLFIMPIPVLLLIIIKLEDKSKDTIEIKFGDAYPA